MLPPAPFLPQAPGGGTKDPFALLREPVMVRARNAQHLPDVQPTNVWQGAAPMAAEVSIEDVRALSAEEVASLRPARLGRADGLPSPLRAVERLKTRHHEIARLMAAGLSDTEICNTLGCSLPHLHTLRRSPAFQSLLFHFMQARDEEAVQIGARVKAAASIALDKITEVLTTRGANELPVEWLRKTTTDLLDRAGHSPVQKSVALSATLTKEDIADIKEKYRAPAVTLLGGAQVIDAEPTPDSSPAEVRDLDPGKPLGG